MDKLTKEFAEFILQNIGWDTLYDTLSTGSCRICEKPFDNRNNITHYDHCIYRKAELFLELWELVNG